MSLTQEDLKAIGEILDSKLDEQNLMISDSFTRFETLVDEKLTAAVQDIEGHIDELYKRTETNDDERVVIGRQLIEANDTLEDHEARIAKLEKLPA